jgi:hypothetical protein
VDAFNSDAIPVHLLTQEAMDVYHDHLKEGGLLLFHTSNRHLDLNRVLSGVALSASSAENDKHLAASSYCLASDSAWIAEQAGHYPHLRIKENEPTVFWTDDFSNILSVFK